MPQLRRIGRVYYSDLYVAGKRVRKKLSTDRRVADEKLAELVKGRDALRYGHTSAVPWAAFKQRYLEYCAGSKARWTLVRDQFALKALEDFSTPRVLEDITPELLERWKGARKLAGKGWNTINRDLASIKAMMARAKLWGYVKAWDPAAVKRLKTTRGRLLFYTMEELQRLLAVCRATDGEYDFLTIALLGARAGLRPAEIQHLTWADLDLKRGLLSITPKPGWQPKDKEQRHLPIPPDLLQHLQNLPRRGEWVIGARPSDAVLSAYFRKLVRRAGLKGSLYTTRHTYASHLAQAGVSLFIIGELLGHADPEQTMVYAHLQPSTLSGAVERLPALTNF